MNGQAISEDLRLRVVGCVEAGYSTREAAALFSVSVASVVRWSQRKRSSGSVAAKPVGGRQQRAQRDWMLARIAEKPDLTLRELGPNCRSARLRRATVRYGASSTTKASASKKKPARVRAGPS